MATSICPVCEAQGTYAFSSRDLMFNLYERYDYHECSACKVLFQYPRPTEAQISQFYPDTYDVYEERTRLKKISAFKAAQFKTKYGYQHLKTHFLYDCIIQLTSIFESSEYQFPFVENGRLLDIGCGNGRFLHGMQQLGWKTKGVEFNEGAVQTCHQSGLDVHHGDLLSANLADESFDVINLSHVIEHVPDPNALFKEAARILKKGGLFLVRTPNSEALGRALFNTNWFANEVPRHLFLFSSKNLTKIGHAHGFSIHHKSTSSTPKIILNSVDYVLGNRGKPSKKIGWRRMLAKPYVWLANYKKRGDELLIVYKKNSD